MDMQSIITSAVTSSTVTGLGILGLQIFLKQGISYQFSKKSQEINHDYNKKIQEVNHHFNEKLATFNQQITISAETRKLDFDRKIHDFSLYSKKRHEVYPEFLKQIYGLYNDLLSFKFNPDLRRISSGAVDESKDRIIPSIKKLGLKYGYALSENFENLISEINEIINKIEDLNECIVKVNDVFEDYLRVEFTKRYTELDGFFVYNLLYLSDNVSNKAKDILWDLEAIVYSDEWGEEEEALHVKIENLKQKLKEELTIGDYSR